MGLGTSPVCGRSALASRTGGSVVRRCKPAGSMDDGASTAGILAAAPITGASRQATRAYRDGATRHAGVSWLLAARRECGRENLETEVFSTQHILAPRGT